MLNNATCFRNFHFNLRRQSSHASHASANGTKVDRTDSATDGQLSSSPVSTARCREIIPFTSMRFVSFASINFSRLFFSTIVNFFPLFLPTESTSDLVEGQYASSASRLIYGVFTTADNAIAGSAVCAFALQVNIDDREKFSWKIFFFQQNQRDLPPNTHLL